MPSDAAMRAAKAIFDTGLCTDMSPSEQVPEEESVPQMAEIIDREMSISTFDDLPSITAECYEVIDRSELIRRIESCVAPEEKIVGWKVVMKRRDAGKAENRDD